MAGTDSSANVGVSAVTSSNPAIVVTAVKQAEDGSGDVVLRCYESSGGRSSGTLSTAFRASQLTVCDFLERAYPSSADAATLVVHSTDSAAVGASISVTLRPFQIVTLRLTA